MGSKETAAIESIAKVRYPPHVTATVIALVTTRAHLADCLSLCISDLPNHTTLCAQSEDEASAQLEEGQSLEADVYAPIRGAVDAVIAAMNAPPPAPPVLAAAAAAAGGEGESAGVVDGAGVNKGEILQQCLCRR
jgi:hypothetical protein